MEFSGTEANLWRYCIQWYLENCYINGETFFSASGKIDDQIFINKNISAPGVLRFHPYEPYLAVADRGGVRYVFM